MIVNEDIDLNIHVEILECCLLQDVINLMSSFLARSTAWSPQLEDGTE